VRPERLCDLLGTKPDAVIALPTGHTPLGLYAELVRRSDAGQLRLDLARYFNLDDYRGLAEDHPLSYARFLRRHLFAPARIPETQVRLLQGNAPDAQAECLAFDAAIDRAGGIDLAILGVGVNGHIAFNEPGAAWTSCTHVVTLDAQTRATHREQAADAHAIPLQGMTMGVATIRAARRILLLVSGKAKQPALEALLRGTADARWPVTSLLGHPQLQVMAEVALRPRPA
jgi:glucosamine-6-phosphate deaminase